MLNRIADGRTNLVFEFLLGGGDVHSKDQDGKSCSPTARTRIASPKPAPRGGDFMRDCRTWAETPLHRAARFGTEQTIELLIEAGAKIDAKDMHGDTPLRWASW